jgi:predicted nucleotidyltransferase
VSDDTIPWEKLRRQVEAHPYPLLFATISGAHLYGFPSADSDFDLRGIHLLPIEQVVGLDPGEETVEKSGVHDGIEVDLVTHDAKKFFNLMLKKNGYVLEQLLSPLIVHTTPEHDELKSIARDCITRHHAHHYLGFAATQWKLFRKEEPPRVKPLLYVYRVLLTGLHLMATGEVEANLLRLNETAKLPYIDDLVARKLSGPEKGHLDTPDVEFHELEYKRLVAELELAGKQSHLPERPAEPTALSDLLVRLRINAVEGIIPIQTNQLSSLRNAKPAYMWKVRCINRRTKEMFDRTRVFDRELCADADEANLVLSLLADRTQHRKLIEFRHVFREVDEKELLAHFKDHEHAGFGSVFLSDYFEDEEGRPLDEVDLIAIKSGQSNPVILGNVSSILRLGPSGMLNAGDWTVENSNDFVHFIQVVGILQRSRWWRDSPKLSWTGNDGSHSLENPDLETTTAALALIRQFLLHRDDIFRRATELYLKFVDDGMKQAWVKHELDQFEAHLKGSWRMPQATELSGFTNEELIDVVVYGTGLFHRKSNSNLEDRLMQLTTTCPRETLMFAFDMACRLMLNHPFTAAPLFYREFAHWSNTGICPRPTRVVTPRLFGTTGRNQS